MASRTEATPRAAWALGFAGFVLLTFVTRAMTDPFAAPKAGIFWLTGAAVAVTLGSQAVRHGIPDGLPRRPLLLALAVPGALIVGLLATDDILPSLLGNAERYAGVFTYASGALVVVAIAWFGRTSRRVPQAVVVGLVGATLVSSAYALVQVTGMDPWAWSFGETKAIGLQGSTNYAAAMAAASVGPSLVLAWRADSPRWRLVGIVAALVGVGAALATGTSQGLLLLPVAAVVPVMAWLHQQESGPLATHGPRIVGVGLGVVGTLVIIGILGVGPASRLASDRNAQDRAELWVAAAGILADHPVLGIGPSRFGVHIREYRSAEEAQQGAATRAATDPHSVPVAMALDAGPLGLLAHLAFVLAVGRRLWRRMREDRGSDAWLVAAGSLWLVYQAQSGISLDVPSLVALHWFSAGAVIALTVPVAKAAKAPGSRKKARGKAHPLQQQPRRSPAMYGLAVGSVLVAGLLVQGAVLLLPAQTTSRYGIALSNREDALDGAVLLEAAARRATWQAELPTVAGRAWVRAGNLDQAAVLLQMAVDRREGAISPYLLLMDVHLARQDSVAALVTAKDLVAFDPQVGATWYQLARAHEAAGEPELAAEAAREALQRDPDLEDAKALLQRVVA